MIQKRFLAISLKINIFLSVSKKTQKIFFKFFLF